MPKKISTYTDGGARGNPGPAAIGIVLVNDGGNTLIEQGKRIGITTNNVAEYTALITGLELAKHEGATDVTCYSDSELIIRQLTGLYRVRAPHLAVLFSKVKECEAWFSKVNYRHVPRSNQHIAYADRLVNEALDDTTSASSQTHYGPF